MIELEELRSFGFSPKTARSIDTDEHVIIAVEYSDLSDIEKKAVGNYIDGENLVVDKLITWRDSRINSSYHGYIRQNEDFADTRFQGRVAEKREAYNALLSLGKYADLPAITNRETGKRIDEILREWEGNNQSKLTPQRDPGDVIGFGPRVNISLDQFTQYIYVPAVRDASIEAAEGKGSALSEIMDLVVRNELTQHTDILKLQRETQQRYNEIITDASEKELKQLAGTMSKTMTLFAPTTEISLDWMPQKSIEIKMPQAKIKLIEDGYPAGVSNAGHGAQRAFILTALQHLVNSQNKKSRENPESEERKNDIYPDIVLAIEEPELYQHPSRQRYLSRIFMQLAQSEIAGYSVPQCQDRKSGFLR